MSGLSQIDQADFSASLQQKLAGTAASLNRCLGSAFQLETAELQPYSTSPPDGDLLQPGVIVSLWVGDEVILCALPEALPLPAWYTQPDTTQQSRLDTLAMEWAATCLPDDLPGETFTTDIVPSLWDAIAACEVSESATWLPIHASTSEGPGGARIWLLWPSSTSPRESTPQWSDEPPIWNAAAPVPATTPQQPDTGASAVDQEAAKDEAKAAARRQMLLGIPVSVIVKLAEKKIELGQLMALGPGTIVTFEKSCEDLLDLYVNNQLFCRGEAVKIGEKFGIKVNEVGSVEERVSAVLGWNS